MPLSSATMGVRRTQEMALLDTRVGAEEATRIGLITRVVADGTLEAETQSVAARRKWRSNLARSRTRADATVMRSNWFDDH